MSKAGNMHGKKALHVIRRGCVPVTSRTAQQGMAMLRLGWAGWSATGASTCCPRPLSSFTRSLAFRWSDYSRPHCPSNVPPPSHYMCLLGCFRFAEPEKRRRNAVPLQPQPSRPSCMDFPPSPTTMGRVWRYSAIWGSYDCDRGARPPLKEWGGLLGEGDVTVSSPFIQ